MFDQLALTKEMMGLLALGILWVNTLLVIGAAFWSLRELLGWYSRLGGRLVEGVARDSIATAVVEQVGRRAANDAGRHAILWHDRSHRCEIAGGVVDTVDGPIQVAAVDTEQAEVWVSQQAQQRAASCPSAAAFVQAYAGAKKAKGFVREVRTEIGSEQPVWIHGQRSGDQLLPPADGPMLVSAIAPRKFCRAKAMLLVLFMFAVVAASSCITWLALYPPIFGTISTIGGAVGLIYFLLLQPAGVVVRDATLLPSISFLRGDWVDPDDSDGSHASSKSTKSTTPAT